MKNSQTTRLRVVSEDSVEVIHEAGVHKGTVDLLFPQEGKCSG